MSFTIRNLLEVEHLGLSLEAGEAGVDGELSWAHVCEIDDPRPWMDGGELIMTTGLAIRRGAKAQVEYLERLLEAGVAGLAVAENMSAPPLTGAMKSLANEVGFPILRVSYEVPFIAISKVVLAANHESFERRMLRTLTIFDSLRRGSTVLDSTLEVLARLEELSGYELGLASTDRHLVLGNPSLAGVLPELPDPGAPERPVVEVSTVEERRCYALPLSIGGRFSGFLLAREQEKNSGAGTLALQNAATVAAVQLAGIQRSRDGYFRLGAEVLADLFAGHLPQATMERRLQLAGVDSADPLVLIAVEGVPASGERSLYDHLCDRGVLPLVARAESLVWVAMPAKHCHRLVRDDELTPAFGMGSRAGASRPLRSFSDVGAAAVQARWALAEAVRRQHPFVDVEGSFDAGEHLGWLPTDPFLLGEITERTLGPLLSGDRSNADLLATLAAYLDEGQKVDATCRRLGIHRHTLSYRLRRIEELTARSLQSTDDLVELWRALRARSALAPLKPSS